MKRRSSQYRGVSFHKVHQLWQAYIRDVRAPFSKRQRSIGMFRTELEAAQAYNEAAVEMYGDRAVLNELPTDPMPPDPIEIANACAAIRLSWSEKDFAERAPHWVAAGAELYVLDVRNLAAQ